MEIKDEFTDEERGGIWQFPSCLIQDVSCFKEEVADEITVKEDGVYPEVDEESNAHNPYEAFHFVNATVGVWPVKLDMTEDLVWQHIC